MVLFTKNRTGRKPFTVLCSLILIIMATSCTTQSIEDTVNSLYEKMTKEERLAQLQSIYIQNLFDKDGNLDTARCTELIPHGIGHCSQFALNSPVGPNKLRDMVAQLQDWLKNNTTTGIPALPHEEVLSGIDALGATVYPQQIGLACSFNTDLAEQKTFQTATQLRRIGGIQALSPMVDVCRDPSFSRLEESYGEDAYLSAALGTAFVKGLQHGNLKEGVAACTKHYLGYGGGGEAEEKELMEEILLPHETAIRLAGSKTVMPGYHAFKNVKCVANKFLLDSILRNYLHFDGIIVSDYGAIEQIDDNLNDIQRAATALNAGNDVDFPEGTNYVHLHDAIAQGFVSEKTLETAVKRVLKHKADLGLLDKTPYLYDKGDIKWDTPEERQTAYQLATQSVVLLKNNGILPLKQESGSLPKDSVKIALTGPNANTMWAMLGDYTFQAMSFFWKQRIIDDKHPQIVNLRMGMQSRLPKGFTLNYSRGCDWTETVETVVEQSGDPRVAYLKDIQNRMIDSGEKADMNEALKIAAESDVIIAAMGENAILCGENRDRIHRRLPGKQEEFVKQLIATGKPVVLVIFGGRAQIISSIEKDCAAIIQAWYPGEEGGNALADILYGNVSPSGKLSVSYPGEEISGKVCYNTSVQQDPRIAWPFGFGMSYTTFEYSNIKVDATAGTNAENFNVSADITNTGSYSGDEIVQLYVSPTGNNKNLRPIQMQGFARISLKPNEKKTVKFNVSPQQLGYYDKGQWNIAPGTYTIKLGASSTDIKGQGDITLTGEAQTMPLRTNYFTKVCQ
ncbi:MAG: glycoside hydrolase family 3 C-terminal domain-containing protein [Bacteroidaceae bacterium]|nr:glycoside hydrolase family 3 C-terminal domain-containing protein [Bacteroidaceae bacterium]